MLKPIEEGCVFARVTFLNWIINGAAGYLNGKNLENQFDFSSLSLAIYFSP